MDKERISLSEAASRLETTALKVLMHIKQELLVAEVVDGSWYVDPISLEKFLAKKEDSSQGNGCKSSCVHKCSSCGQG